MKTVILTSGPRGSGKSTFVNAVKAQQPEIAVVSRDEILVSMFGSSSLSPYTGEHAVGFRRVLAVMKETLSNNHPSERIIFDCWNGYSLERKGLIEKLRELGADEIQCLQFLIPADICVEWFMKKPNSNRWYEDSIRRDHGLYYSTAENIEEDGFDAIFRVNSNQLRFEGWPLI